jgi:hypothetical protein
MTHGGGELRQMVTVSGAAFVRSHAAAGVGPALRFSRCARGGLIPLHLLHVSIPAGHTLM